MRKSLIRGTAVAAAALTLAAIAHGQSLSAPAADSSTTPAGATVPDKDVYCAQALETYLPGDYYACVARQDFGRQHYRAMEGMLEEAAYWANKNAQYVLGIIHFNGNTDIPQDRALAIAWFALAAERKNPDFQLAYASARAKATPAELAGADVLLRGMRAKYSDDVAIPRAVKRFNHNIKDIDDAATAGGIVWLNGFSPFPESAFKVANQLHDQASAEFDGWRGTVVVGRPDWLKKPPASSASAAGP